MKRVFKTFIVLLTIFMVKQSSVLADDYFGIVVTSDKNTTVAIRKGPGTSFSSYPNTRTGSMWQLTSNIAIPNSGTGTCPSWYEIYVTPVQKGYMCSTYIDVVTVKEDGTAPSTTCETQLSNAGFPSSYWGALCYLKGKYPNWSFIPIPVSYTWEYSLSQQLRNGHSMISTSYPEFLHATNTASDGPYKSASEMALNFYMDPRRMLSPRRIFQFNSLRYENSLEDTYKNSIDAISSGAGYYNYHKDVFTDYLFLAGQTSRVSPIGLASRIRQELGSSSTGSVYDRYSGLFTGSNNKYYGYYNFYNYGVNTGCSPANGGPGPAICALDYAERSGWNSVYGALLGGANNIYTGYVEKGKYTKYFEKYNVVPKNGGIAFAGQYMTNIKAAMDESALVFAALVDKNFLDKPYAFDIPIYKDMYPNFGGGTSSGGTVTTGQEIRNLVIASGYNYSSGTISKINPSSNLATIKTNLERHVGAGNVTVYNNNNQVVTSGIIGTGFKVNIKYDGKQETLSVVVKGDTSGDGVVNALDLLQVQKHILGTDKLSGAFLQSADTSGDGTINALDLLQVQKQILGTYTIKQ